MKLRIEYSKLNEAKYLSHLDVLKLFEKLIRRIDLNVEYTKGFNKRPILVFAHPSSVGIESICEIVEITVLEDIQNIEELKEDINNNLIEGIKVNKIDKIVEKEKNLMSRVYKAEYRIQFKEDYEKLEEFLNQKNIYTDKKTKKGIKNIDIKPMIRKFNLKSQVLEIVLDTGSKSNLRPDLVIKAYCDYIEKEELYTNITKIRVEF